MPDHAHWFDWTCDDRLDVFGRTLVVEHCECGARRETVREWNGEASHQDIFLPDAE